MFRGKKGKLPSLVLDHYLGKGLRRNGAIRVATSICPRWRKTHRLTIKQIEDDVGGQKEGIQPRK